MFYPDYTETQRIGIVPDVEIHPTIAGIREGRDELLEAAVHGIPASPASLTYNNSSNPSQLPDAYLLQNYPNPFNPTTEICFSLPHACHAKLEIFNITGQRIQGLVNRQMEAGYHTVSFDGSKVASGVYLYRLEAGDFVESKKMILIK